MTLQRKIAEVSGALSIFSLVLSWIGYRCECNFFSNVFMGLFSSGILICGVAAVTFFSECRTRLYRLYCECIDFSQMAPFGYRASSEQDLPIIHDKISQALSLYNKGIQENLIELQSLPKFTKAHKIVAEIDDPSFTLKNALLEINEKITPCILQQSRFDSIVNYKFSINSKDMDDISERFANAVTSLVKYLKQKRIQMWRNTDHAD